MLLAEEMPIDTDDAVDASIKECIEGNNNTGFITFAGAGSGKTYSLKKALEHVQDKYGQDFARSGKQIAVITFTNNAADEIRERVERSPVFAISVNGGAILGHGSDGIVLSRAA